MSTQKRMRKLSLMMENYKQVCVWKRKSASIKIALCWEGICYCTDEINRGNWHRFFFNMGSPAEAVVINNALLATPLVTLVLSQPLPPSGEDKCDLN